eukprot:13596843-Alexandrium_andersonii.AAC.1
MPPAESEAGVWKASLRSFLRGSSSLTARKDKLTLLVPGTTKAPLIGLIPGHWLGSGKPGASPHGWPPVLLS